MKTALNLILSVAVTLILVSLLLHWTGTEWSGIWRAMRSVELRWYLAALGVQLCIYPLRALRFGMLLNHAEWRRDQQTAPLSGLLPVSMAHNFFAYLLPAKLGEGVLIWYLKKLWGIPASRGLVVLLVSRLLDLLAVCAFLCVACLWIGWTGASQNPDRVLALGFLLLPICLLMIVGLLQGATMVAWGRRIGGPALRRCGRFGFKLETMFDRLQDGLSQLPRPALWRAALISPPIWVGVFMFYALLVRGIGIDSLSLPQATIGAGLAVLFGLLPVSAFAGFGTQDIGWVIGFVEMGVERIAATESGIAIHLIYALHIWILGLLGHAWARRWGPSDKS